jgi:hypothetical protein
MRCGEKRHLLSSRLCIKMMILPRQARDKHRESAQKKEWRLWQAAAALNDPTIKEVEDKLADYIVR